MFGEEGDVSRRKLSRPTPTAITPATYGSERPSLLLPFLTRLQSYFIASCVFLSLVHCSPSIVKKMVIDG